MQRKAQVPAQPQGAQEGGAPQKKLYIRLRSDDAQALRRVELLLEMFPGGEQMVLYFADTGKRLGATCVLHRALLRELRELLGDENVVLK